ncbi:ADP-ribose-binding protein [Desulfurispirillum indicum]|uniref:ADP-ribose-binding protein n=1 Tax=Desulfurispirillum indicum TaxID=936456 RepID=UPI001CFB6D7E|nr:ADP-ribose-binding protein [Desulfurispirillum indicum]UCZ57089.1 ADP-ribose-binding protein [Desulfurispirillum indicum]
MRMVSGNLWDYLEQCPVVITTGGQLNRRGHCSMPRGCAAQARQRFPHLPAQLGALIRQHGNHVFVLDHQIIAFPIENGPMEPPDLGILKRSTRELVELTDRHQWPQVVLPRPGCGSGGLEWPVVRSILERSLDSRFLIVDSQNPADTGETP